MKKILSLIILILFFPLMAIASESVEVSQVVVTNHAMQRGDVIGSGDVRMATTNTLDSRAVTDMDDVIGKRLIRPLGNNNSVKKDYLKDAPVISVGEKIMVVVQNKHLKVSARAIAKEDGSVGDLIRVENLGSGKIINARVAGPALVVINF